MGATSSKSTVTKHFTNGITEAEWEALPITFDAPTMARLICCCTRYVQNHAEELGGHKIADRWVFSKVRAAELLDL